MSSAVRLEVDELVATLTLDREGNRNSMTAELLDSFAEQIEALKQRQDVRAVVITGTGRHFCAGADFKTSAELMQRSGLEGPAGMRESTKQIYSAFLGVLDLEVPTIAAVNGHAIGGGLGLALVCDLRIVSTEAKLGANFVRLGLHPGMGISYFLPRLVGVQDAAELLYTGRIVKGEEAATRGLALRAVAPDRVLAEANALAREIAAAAPYAVRRTKRTFQAALRNRLEDVIEMEASAQSLCAGMEDAREGIAALLGKREPKFQGR